MKQAEELFVYFDVTTSAGQRYPHYTASERNSLGASQHIHHGLG